MDVRAVKAGRASAGDGRVRVVSRAVRRFLRRPAATEVRCRCSIAGICEIRPVYIARLREAGILLGLCVISFGRSLVDRTRHTFFCFARSGRIVFTRLRLLITSVLREMGRGRPWSLRKRPQALQRTAPVSSRLHRGVLSVPQFWQVGCAVSRSWLAMVAMMGAVIAAESGRVPMLMGARD